jgi:hypothetical protein
VLSRSRLSPLFLWSARPRKGQRQGRSRSRRECPSLSPSLVRPSRLRRTPPRNSLSPLFLLSAKPGRGQHPAEGARVHGTRAPFLCVPPPGTEAPYPGSGRHVDHDRPTPPPIRRRARRAILNDPANRPAILDYGPVLQVPITRGRQPQGAKEEDHPPLNGGRFPASCSPTTGTRR